MYPPITITTKRLILRPWKESDVLPFSLMNKDPEVRKFFPDLLTFQQSEEMVKKLQEEFSTRGYGLWAVEIPSEADFIGFIGLHYQNFPAPFTPCVEIGWRLAKQYWKKGYATEGAKAVLEYAFTKLGLEEIFSFTVVENKASRAVMERIGMTHNPADDFDHPLIPDDHHLKRHVLYRITKKDWLPHQQKVPRH